ncbi:MAG: hypothetical protein QOK48_2186, partial [Blastocatellia bacterium]|nr:hypothetical protein [Blastocatellia bacterium]
DGIDALTRDTYGVRKFLLRPPALAAQLLHSILNSRRHVKLAFHAQNKIEPA